MKNVISMDMYKMYKSKSTWIILGIFIAIMALVLYASNSQPQIQEQGSNASADSEFSIEFSQKSVGSEYAYLVSGDMIALFLTVFVIVYMSNEKKEGYIKNIWGSIPKKSQYMLSKMIILAIFDMLLFFSLFIVTFLECKFYFRTGTIGSISQLSAYIITQYLLTFTFGYLVLLLDSLIDNSIVLVAVCCGYIFCVAQILYTLLNKAIDAVFHIQNFKISKYLVYGNMYLVSLDSGREVFVRAVSVGLIFLLAISFLLLYQYRKKEL